MPGAKYATWTVQAKGPIMDVAAMATWEKLAEQEFSSLKEARKMTRAYRRLYGIELEVVRTSHYPVVRVVVLHG